MKDSEDDDPIQPIERLDWISLGIFEHFYVEPLKRGECKLPRLLVRFTARETSQPEDRALYGKSYQKFYE